MGSGSYPQIPIDSGSDMQPNRSTPPESNSQDVYLSRSGHGNIPRCHFGIEGESFMCTPLDVDELASYHEALSLANSKTWIAIMEDEMDSMMRN